MIYRADHRSVKVMGRTLYKGGVRYLGNSASYIEFSFTGTRASARLVVSNDADTSEMRACMAVIVNDEEDKAKREVLADGEWEMELFVCERPETVIQIWNCGDPADTDGRGDFPASLQGAEN